MRFGKGADATSDVRDLRTGGDPGGGTGGFGGLGGLPIPTGRMGKGAGGILALVLVLVIGYCTQAGGGGRDLADILNTQFPAAGTAPDGQDGPPPAESESDRALREFSGQVFNDTQDFWAATFDEAGEDYRNATLTIFDTPVSSSCGGAQAAIGPHYCPPDDTVFIELGFFQQLASEFGAAGDFAQAYVIAHEMGHHVQNVLGTSDEVRQLQEDNPERATGPDGLSVRLELQADCYAGVWAKTVYDRGMLDPGDIEEGLRAAEVVGDDRIQEKATGRVDPESWTHGSSEQRQRWFRDGFDSGRADSCDTFSGGSS